MRTILLLVLLAGCSKSELVTKMESFKDQACACKDAACAEKVRTAQSEYFLSVAKSLSEDDVAKDVDKLEEIEKEEDACFKKLGL